MTLYAGQGLNYKPLKSVAAGQTSPSKMSKLPHLSSLTWHCAAVCGDNLKSDGPQNSLEQHTRICCCSCSYHVKASGLWPSVFYSLATVHVYQQSAPSLLKQLAAVTITSGMRKDSCEGKAGDLSRALSHSAVQEASCPLCYCTCLKEVEGLQNLTWKTTSKQCLCMNCLKALNFYFVMVLIKVMVVE